jgi:hypothetical protein
LTDDVAMHVPDGAALDVVAIEKHGTGWYDLVRFDLHEASVDGAHVQAQVAAGRYLLSGVKGVRGHAGFLFFETGKKGVSELKGICEAAGLLAEHRAPMAMLNRCQRERRATARSLPGSTPCELESSRHAPAQIWSAAGCHSTVPFALTQSSSGVQPASTGGHGARSRCRGVGDSILGKMGIVPEILWSKVDTTRLLSGIVVAAS